MRWGGSVVGVGGRCSKTTKGVRKKITFLSDASAEKCIMCFSKKKKEKKYSVF